MIFVIYDKYVGVSLQPGQNFDVVEFMAYITEFPYHKLIDFRTFVVYCVSYVEVLQQVK